MPIKHEENMLKMEFEKHLNNTANFCNSFFQTIYSMGVFPGLFSDIKHEPMVNQVKIESFESQYQNFPMFSDYPFIQMPPQIFPLLPIEMTKSEFFPNFNKVPILNFSAKNAQRNIESKPFGLEMMKDSKESINSFTQVDMQLLTKISVPRLQTFSEEINSSLIRSHKKLSAFSFFSFIFKEPIIKKLCITPPESNLLSPLQEINVFLVRLLLKSILANFTSARTDKCEFLHIFKQISSAKLKKKLHTIHRKFQDISMKTFANQGETLHRLVYEINNSLREVYCPSQNLAIVQRVFMFSRKQVKMLLLIDKKTGFVSKFAIKFTMQKFTNLEILGLLEDLPNDRTYSLYLEENLLDVELLKTLKIKKINAFGLFKSEDLKNKYPYSCELLKRNDGLLVCVLNEINVMTNLNEKGIVMNMEEQENINENDVFSFFKKKYTMTRFSHKRNTKKMLLKTLHEKIVTFIMSVCMKNAFILADEYGDTRFKSFNLDEFQMQVLKGMMGKNY